MELRRRDEPLLSMPAKDLPREQPEFSRSRRADENAPQISSEHRCTAD